MFFWIIIFLVFIVIFLFCFFYQYTPYYVTTGIYEEEGKYVSFMLENNKLLYLQNATISIEDMAVDSSNILVGEVFHLESKLYQNITVLVEKKLENPTVNVLFQLPKTTILRKIWKGMME